MELEKVIKALECCSSSPAKCGECPCTNDSVHCQVGNLMSEALNHIKILKERADGLYIQLMESINDTKRLEHHIEYKNKCIDYLERKLTKANVTYRILGLDIGEEK